MEIIQDRKVSALIDYAADLLEMHGWQIGELWSNTPKHVGGFAEPNWPGDFAPVREGEYTGGAMCTEGALRAADLLIHTDMQFPVQSDVFTDAFHSCRVLLPDFDMGKSNTRTWTKRPSIAMWNDHACCTKEEAVAFLRDCAIKTRPDMA